MEPEERIERRSGLLGSVEPDAQLAAGKQVEHADADGVPQPRIFVAQLKKFAAVEQFAQPHIGPRLGRDAEPPPEHHEKEQHAPRFQTFHHSFILQVQ